MKRTILTLLILSSYTSPPDLKKPMQSQIKKIDIYRPLMVINRDTVYFRRNGDTLIFVGHKFSDIELSKLKIEQ